jgi:hypothetical protein
LVRRGRELTQAQTAVVGRRQAMTVYPEPRPPQSAADVVREHCVHEDAAAQDYDIQYGRPANPVAHGGDHLDQRGVEPPGDELGVGAPAGVAGRIPDHRPTIDHEGGFRGPVLQRLHQIEQIGAVSRNFRRQLEENRGADLAPYLDFWFGDAIVCTEVLQHSEEKDVHYVGPCMIRLEKAAIKSKENVLAEFKRLGVKRGGK